MFQIKINGVQEAISGPIRKPNEYSPIYVYASKIEHDGEDYGKASISDLVLFQNAKGYILDEDSGIVDKNISISISGSGVTKGTTVIFNNFDGKHIAILDITVKRYQLLKPTLKSWGPSYEINFNIKVRSFNGQVLHFCTLNKEEDGVPTIEAINHRIEVTTIINGRPMRLVTEQLKLNRWYHTSIKQLRSRRNPDKVCMYFLKYINLYSIINLVVISTDY